MLSHYRGGGGDILFLILILLSFMSTYLKFLKISFVVFNQICIVVGNPNLKKMHIFGFVGIFEYICYTTFNIIFSMCTKP